MKESEAKTKWCPQANVYFPYQNTGAGGNRNIDRDLEYLTNCIASRCMMWEPEYEEEIKITEGNKVPDGWHLKSSMKLGRNEKTEIKIGRYVKNNKGGCGLKTKENGCFYPG